MELAAPSTACISLHSSRAPASRRRSQRRTVCATCSGSASCQTSYVTSSRIYSYLPLAPFYSYLRALNRPAACAPLGLGARVLHDPVARTHPVVVISVPVIYNLRSICTCRSRLMLYAIWEDGRTGLLFGWLFVSVESTECSYLCLLASPFPLQTVLAPGVCVCGCGGVCECVCVRPTFNLQMSHRAHSLGNLSPRSRS